MFKRYRLTQTLLQNSVLFNAFSLHDGSTEDVFRLLRAINDKKSTGKDKILPKLVHLAAMELSIQLTKAIHISIRNSTFPERAKTAAVTPLDKGEPIRTIEKNIHPVVSMLNTVPHDLL